ncbi:MAG TPA: hypothetical protein VKT82_02990 [Ktedonobacterales bacterium]|nr:hypothetical protein [Ktedonobacterales bacterium]
MQRQGERITRPQAGGEYHRGQTPIPNPGSGPIVTNSPFQAFPLPTPGTSDDELPPIYADDDLPNGLQEAHITAILRSMALGHLFLGAALALGGVIIEILLQQPAFFGLAASGGMLGACGLITLLAIQRQRSGQSPLAFYLLPYADFAIVGLWLLLFGVTGPTALFYAYVVISAALLLGSRHAIALTAISGATILAISLEQTRGQVTPAITLPGAGQIAFTIASTTLALALIAYVARLFSLNLDRFIAQTNRQREDLLHIRRFMAERQEQVQADIENLSNTYVRFISGDTKARILVPTPKGSLAFASHLLNTLLEQLERHQHAAAAHLRLEERIGELSQALDRLTTGDITGLHIIGNATGTPLDTLTLALGRVGRQLLAAQQALKQAIGGYTAVLGLASDLSSLRQTLSATDSALRDIQKRSDQSAGHLHTMLENKGDSTERPILHEMELGAHQQISGAELLRARLGHIGVQMQSIETELRRITESMEQLTRTSRPLRAEQASAPATPQSRPDSASRNVREHASSASPAPARSPGNPARGADALPRRFTGPLMPPGRQPAEKLNAWQIPLGHTETEANGPQQ